jgi:hypothetical protein
LPVSDETKYGADIGIRVTLRTAEAEVAKGLLIQCKRMYGSTPTPSYKELRGRGEKQATDMLRITPASFFMLHNFGSQRDLLNWTSIPSGTVCPMDEEGVIGAPKHLNIADKCPIWASSSGIWDLGIAVLPATRVLALSAKAASLGRKCPDDVSTILRGRLPLGEFMADLVGGCFVGDVREEVIRIVTPPKQRQPPPFPTALLAFDNYLVRHHINIMISAERRTVRTDLKSVAR